MFESTSELWGVILIIIGVLMLLDGTKLPPVKTPIPPNWEIPGGFVLILIGAFIADYIPWPF